MSKKESASTLVLGSLVILLTIVINFPLRGWTLLCVYDWNVRPLLGGPHWTVMQASSVSFFLSVLLHRNDPDCEKKDRGFAEVIGIAFGKVVLFPLFILPIAWLLAKVTW